MKKFSPKKRFSYELLECVLFIALNYIIPIMFHIPNKVKHKLVI